MQFETNNRIIQKMHKILYDTKCIPHAQNLKELYKKELKNLNTNQKCINNEIIKISQFCLQLKKQNIQQKNFPEHFSYKPLLCKTPIYEKLPPKLSCESPKTISLSETIPLPLKIPDNTIEEEIDQEINIYIPSEEEIKQENKNYRKNLKNKLLSQLLPQKFENSETYIQIDSRNR